MVPADDSPRLTAADRREAILRAGAEVFGRRGYVGATTDQIARAAGISQPYVVRLFGTKEALFLEVLESAKHELLTAFRASIAEAGDGGTERMLKALGERYVELARERGVHLSLLQAFVQGADPVVGTAARAGYLQIWRLLLDEAGLSTEQARDFLGQGMLISILLAVDMPVLDASDPDAHTLLQAACGDKLSELFASA